MAIATISERIPDEIALQSHPGLKIHFAIETRKIHARPSVNYIFDRNHSNAPSPAALPVAKQAVSR